ncbi:hypothetical protein ASPSYDRAFT_27509 [Aspergillus sydowii CBS 593.65]|uniref:Uncharacterized protein n=1 Tax=Aspergillus sydowii CBS 593.65 TaxID=1036612 RepID=A0A1L9TQZ5_9EURO|nr:uncharacterized protein ASPSYDRAFT_27509 [Aspergillus sydowii CBS 593.65]OJJ61847.1 hypothetical protein ASPSYDRAFT_27509 [Aspergillus sydowii CBS 593.65]
MRFSTFGILFSLLVLPGLATPVEATDASSLVARVNKADAEFITKRCCINCHNPYASCLNNDKREAVATEEEALFGPQKRCCINCDNPNARCKRDEIPANWPSKRCCINCDNPYASCLTNNKREAVDSLEEAVEGDS